MTLKQGDSKKNMQSVFENITKYLKPQGVDVYKFLVKINLKNDSLKIQQELRNEWE